MRQKVSKPDRDLSPGWTHHPEQAGPCSLPARSLVLDSCDWIAHHSHILRSWRLKDRPYKPLLVVDDCPEDCESIRRLLAKRGVKNPLRIFTTGEQALDYLMRHGAYTDPATSPTPGLILLDLNLPGTDGRDILARIKADERLQMIPVVILTSSDEPADILECYRHGANSYIQKQADLERLAATIDALKEFWLDEVLLPEPS